MTAATIVRGVSSGASNGTLTGTSIAVTPPAGVVAGDQLLLQITTRDAMTGWRAPAGWLGLRPPESSGEGFFYRAEYGTDVTGASWTFDNGAGNTTATKWEWSLVALKGDQVGDFLTGTAQTQASATAAMPSPTISPAAPCHLVAAVGIRITGTPSFTWPAGWVEQTDVQSDPGATNNVAGSIAVYDTTPTAAGSYLVSATSSLASAVGWAGIFAFAVAAPAGPVAPVADFTGTPVTGAAPLTVAFTDTTTGTPTSWAWAFGDGTTSSAQNPSKTYTTSGTYTVSLTSTNAQGSNTVTKTAYIAVAAPGALPGLIDGVEPEAQSRVPPFCDGNGNLYRITEEYLAAGNNPQMNKSTDGGATWNVVDVAGQMAGASLNDLEAAWCLQVGTAIVLLFCDDTSIFYATFNTSDAPINPDTWQVKENGFALGTSSGSRCHVSAVRLSDGRVRAFFLEGPSGTNHQTYYATKTNALAVGGWSARTAFQSTASSYIAVMPVVGAADLVHMFFHDYANKTIRYTTLSSAGVLGTSVRADTTGTSTNSSNFHAASNAVYYDTGSSWTAAALYASSSGVRLVSVVDGVVQAEQLVDSNAPLISPANTDGNTSNDGPQIHLAVQGTTLHAIWTEASSGDLFYSSRAHGGSWSARTRLWDAPAGRGAFWVYSNVYTRAGSVVMGYTYDDGPHADDDSNIYYNEMVLAAAAPAGRVIDVWNGSALVRRRADKWNGTALVQQTITT